MQPSFEAIYIAIYIPESDSRPDGGEGAGRAAALAAGNQSRDFGLLI